MRLLGCIETAALALVAWPAGAQAQVPAVPPQLDESAAVLLQPLLARVPLADTLTAFASSDSALVPLGEVCRLLAFGIQVDAALGRAEGYFISEKRRFHFELATGSSRSEGRIIPFRVDQAVRLGQEIFVDARLLQEWFPLNVKVDLKASLLMIEPKEKLPIQEAWEREGRQSSGSPIQLGAASPGHPVGEYRKFPYSFFEVPFFDLATSWSKSQRTPSRPPTESLAMGGDLLWMSSSLFVVQGSDGKFRNPSYTLFREDPQASLLGPLHATRVELGNLLQSPAQDLVGSLPQGRGVLVDNYPLSYRSKFATRTFQGTLPEGWSVELYQNRGLVGFLKSRSDGRYIFPDVPLRFGLNQFKLVFHGPFGQVREETHRVDIAQDQPPPGTFYYRIAGLRPLRIRSESDGSLSSPDQAALAEAQSHTDGLAEVEYGLSSYLAMNASASRIALPDGKIHTYSVAGLRSMFSYLSLQGSAAQDRTPGESPGRAAEGILRTGYEYSSLSIRRSEFRDGFQTVDALGMNFSGRILRSQTVAQLDGSFSVKARTINMNVYRDEKRYVDGSWSATTTGRTTLTFPSFLVSPSLSKTTDSGRSGPAPLVGGLLFTSYVRGHSLQGEANFERSQNGTKLTGWSLMGDWPQSSGLVYRFGLRGPDSKLSNATMLASFSKLAGTFGAGVDLQYSKISGYTLGLRAQVSFSREPRTGRWVTQACPTSSLGAMSAIAFADANGNKLLDEGERVFEGSQFKISNSPEASDLKDPKVTFRTNLPRGQEVMVQVDETSLEDPALKSTVRAYRFVPRPGKVAWLDFPIAPFGEISGTTRIRRDSGIAEFGGLELELLGADGVQVKTLRSAYDGFFEFRDLPLRDYLLRVRSEDVVRLRLKEPRTRKFHLDNLKNLFEGQDLVVEKNEPENVQAPPPPPPPSSSPRVSAANLGVAAAPPTSRPLPIPPAAAKASSLHTPQTRTPESRSSWTIVLVYALEESTIAKAKQVLHEQAGELFVQPLPRIQGGKPLQRVCFGRFSSPEEAQKAVVRLPRHFFLEGNRPKVLPVDMPTTVGRLP